ncbi:MAG TPA: maleylpyruvate isomerase family mycothiol-dependent enzyme [Streptosporangiaceae bacterium]
MASPANSAGVLAGAIRYALGSLTCVKPGFLARPTPCATWDLATLLQHVNDSLAALHEGIATGSVSFTGSVSVTGSVSLAPAAETADDPGGLVATFRDRASHLLAASATARNQDGCIAIADRRLAGRIVTAVGAVEIAVHGWDVAEACRCRRPIPPALATGILKIIPLVVTDATRDARFAAPVTVSPRAGPGDRLIALLGRSPPTPSATQSGQSAGIRGEVT